MPIFFPNLVAHLTLSVGACRLVAIVLHFSSQNIPRTPVRVFVLLRWIVHVVVSAGDKFYFDVYNGKQSYLHFTVVKAASVVISSGVNLLRRQRQVLTLFVSSCKSLTVSESAEAVFLFLF